MIGAEAILWARKRADAITAEFCTLDVKEAARLLHLLASACEAENARRKLLAAALPAGEAATDALIAWLRGPYPDRMYGLPEMQALLGRIDRLEALLSDAEDTLRARAEGRKAGLLEAAEMCKSRDMTFTSAKIRDHAEALAEEKA